MKVIDIRGEWQTGSGAIYEFFQTGGDVSATYLKPSQDQVNSGVKPGDIAYVGQLTGPIIVRQFHHRAHLDDQRRCPANSYFVDTLYLALSQDAKTMEGDLLVEHISDTCKIDDRRLDHLVFTRV